MENSKEQSANSASGNMTKSKLRYPLRSALKSKEGKPPVPELSGSSSSRRGRVASSVSQSMTALDSAAKDDESSKPTRRLSIPTKAAATSARKSLSNLTPISESRAKRSGNIRGMAEKPVSSTLRSVNRKKVEDLSSATYWLSQIKLSESVAKHSISLGFFKLAQQAGCEPLQQMREELKLYARRNNLDELADAKEELYQLYNISQGLEHLKISEICSVVPEETTLSLNNDVHSSSSTPENMSMMTPEVPKDDGTSQSSTITRKAKANSVNNTPHERTRRSLNDVKVNRAEVQESEGTCSSDDGVPSISAQYSDAKRSNRKEAVPKKNLSVRTRKLTNTASANLRTLPETRADRPQKKTERIVNPRTNRNQEAKNEKSTKKPVCKREGESASPEQTKATEDNKENSILRAVDEIQVE